MSGKWMQGGGGGFQTRILFVPMITTMGGNKKFKAFWFKGERHIHQTGISKFQLFMQIIMPPSGCSYARWLPPALKCLFHHYQQESSLQRSLSQTLQHRLYADRVAGRQACTHFLLLLPSSGHTFFVTLRFSLQEIVTKDEDKKTITCPEQLISVSCICMSAKILPYTETLKRGLSKPVQELRLCLQTEHKGRMDPVFFQSAALETVRHDSTYKDKCPALFSFF